MHISARSCYLAASGTPLMWPSACASRQPTSPEQLNLLGAAVAGRAALGAGNLDTSCVLLEEATAALSGVGPRHRLPVGGTAITSHT